MVLASHVPQSRIRLLFFFVLNSERLLLLLGATSFAKTMNVTANIQPTIFKVPKTTRSRTDRSVS